MLEIKHDYTSFNYPYYVADERGRWLKVCHTYEEAVTWKTILTEDQTNDQE